MPKSRYCSYKCQCEALYDQAEDLARQEARRQRREKVIGEPIAHPRAPRGAVLQAICGREAVLHYADGRRLIRPLSEVYHPVVAKEIAAAHFLRLTTRRVA